MAQVISPVQADAAAACNPEELSVCLSDKVAVETRETMLRESVAAITERRTALETLLEEKESTLQQLQAAYTELETKHTESTRNSEKAMQSLREIHTTQLGLLLEKNTELETSLQTATTQHKTALDHIHVLQKQVEMFTDEHDEAVQLAALKESCAAAATAHAQAVETWQTERESLVVSHAEALDAATTTCATDREVLVQHHTAEVKAVRESTEITAADFCEAQLQRQLESSTTACTAQLTAHNATCQSEIAQAATCRDAVSACQSSCSATTQKAIASERDMVQRWKGRHERLLESHLRTRDSASATAEALSNTRNELFELRRELFLAKEQLRKPLLQRKLLWAAMPMVTSDHIQILHSYWQHAKTEQFPVVTKTTILIVDMVTETWNQVEEAVREAAGWPPKHQSRGIAQPELSWYEQWIETPYQRLLPLYKEYVVPLYSIHLYHDLMVPIYERQLVPWYRSNVVPLYTNHVEPVYTDTILPLYVENVRPIYTDQILPLYTEHAQPLVHQYVHPAIAELQTMLQHTCQAHERYLYSVARMVAYAFDVVADYSALEGLAGLFAIGVWLRDHAIPVVRGVEVVTIILLLVVVLRRRPAPPKKVV